MIAFGLARAAVAPYMRAIKLALTLALAAGLFASGYWLRDVMVQRDDAQAVAVAETDRATMIAGALKTDRANTTAGAAAESVRVDRVAAIDATFDVIERKAATHEKERAIPAATDCSLDTIELWAWNSANAGTADAELGYSAGAADADTGAATDADRSEQQGHAR